MPTFQKPPSKAEMVSTLAERTGLNRETIKDLMKKGWTYSYDPEFDRSRFDSPGWESERKI